MPIGWQTSNTGDLVRSHHASRSTRRLRSVYCERALSASVASRTRRGPPAQGPAILGLHLPYLGSEANAILRPSARPWPERKHAAGERLRLQLFPG